MTPAPINLEELKTRVRDAITVLDPAHRELAAQIAADLAVLGARKAVGDDVDAELRLAMAAGVNLTAEAKTKVATAFSRWLQELVFSFAMKALAAAA